MAVGGLFRSDKADSRDASQDALAVLRVAKAFHIIATTVEVPEEEATDVAHVVPPTMQTHQTLRLRVGLHTGDLFSGIVGRVRPRYCLFGGTVNKASRMESTANPTEIQVSQQTYDLVCHDTTIVKEWLAPKKVQP